MRHSRRSLLLGGGIAAAALLAARPSQAQSTDPAMAPRALGDAQAKVNVTEWFSLTCPHCARFSKETFPDIEKNLVDTGQLYYVFGDFPLDQVALTASMVARSLPAAQYIPFVTALLATQDRWAFARDVNSTAELQKMAALAGMSAASFNAAIGNTALRTAILQEQDRAVKTFGVDSTPSFIFNGPGAKNRKESGEMSFAAFADIVKGAAGA